MGRTRTGRGAAGLGASISSREFRWLLLQDFLLSNCHRPPSKHRDFPASQDEQKEQRLEDKQESSLHLCCRITPDFIQVSDPPGFCLILAVSPVFIALQFRDPIHESKLPPPASTSSLLTPELQGLQRNVPGAAWLQPTTSSSQLLGRAAGSKHFTFQPSGAH